MADVVIVGAGLAGLYMLHQLRAKGMSARVFEAGSGVGGTWYWNRYPGARCDVQSLEYSYSFSDALQQEWEWSERYATQPEILRYVNHVADRFDLRRDITFNARVTRMSFDEDAAEWTVCTDTGEDVRAQFCIMASGCLSAARAPEIEGLASFAGRIYHTGQWPHEPVDFTGQRVGLIGTGSSGIQTTPVVAAQANQLVVFQRTPNFSIPARNGTDDADTIQAWKARYPELRDRARETPAGILYDYTDTKANQVPEAERTAHYEQRWARGGTNFMRSYIDLLADNRANDTAADFVREKIRSIVKDPATAAMLTPHNHPIGTKRICVDDLYYHTFNRNNVRLVDIRATPIEAITPTGVKTSTEDFAFDSLILATGFDAMTGPLLRIDITGRNGERLADAWQAGPRTYLGLMVAGFPNLFTITGPGSPSVLTNMIVSIEQHVDWIAECLAHLRASGVAIMEAELSAQDEWVDHVNEVADRTLFPQANSWYMGANVPGKPRVFMPYVGGFGNYRRRCAEIAAEGYSGFRLSAPNSAHARAVSAA
jgi:cyclohexanone monooxygenase